jgi:hypothetical protein
MFADWVRSMSIPDWTPILIRLRDIRTLRKDLRKPCGRPSIATLPEMIQAG